MLYWIFLSALLFCGVLQTCGAEELNIPLARPNRTERKYHSDTIEEVIVNYTNHMKDKDLAKLFENCFPSTLDTTVLRASEQDTFIITGDIDAMWLRDSMFQVLPYIRFARQDEKLMEMLHGLVRRHLESVLIDPYANGFNEFANNNHYMVDNRIPPVQPTVWEGKYELDSLCAVIKLNYEVVAADSGNVTFLQPVIRQWIEAMEIILSTMSDQQKSTEMQDNVYPYMFFRRYPHGVFEYYPRKNATGYTGMIRSAFRPSDDMTSMDFLVPSNIMASVSLEQLMELCGTMADAFPEYSGRIGDIQRKARTLRRLVQQGLNVAKSNDNILAYEVDGLGNVTMMDDANYPSLLSAPFLGYNADGSLYQRTRGFLLSDRNPWFFSGKAGKGIGSPHTGKDMIWPLSLIMQALTSHDDDEIAEVLETLKRSADNTGFMHEAFNKDNVSDFTRPWFAWANSFFGLLITDLGDRKPHLIF